MTRISRFTGTPFMYSDPPIGFGIRFQVDDDKSVFIRTTFDESKQGGRGILHGGAIASVLDEAMGVASYEAHSAGYTATMSFDYLAHIPLHQEVLIRAWIEKVDGKKMYAHSSATLADGTVAVTGEALFIASEKLHQAIESNPFIAKDE